MHLGGTQPHHQPASQPTVHHAGQQTSSERPLSTNLDQADYKYELTSTFHTTDREVTALCA